MNFVTKAFFALLFFAVAQDIAGAKTLADADTAGSDTALTLTASGVIFDTPRLSHFSPIVHDGGQMRAAIPFYVCPTIDGKPFENGDEIGIFNGRLLCVGAIAWDSTGRDAIVVKGDNDQTPAIDGMLPSEVCVFRMWDKSAGIEYPMLAGSAAGDATYADGKQIQLASLTACTWPVIAGDPSDTALSVGAIATFCVWASGTPPLAYRWLRDGVPIPGATGRMLQITGLTPSHAARYRCEVSNRHGRAISAAAGLSIEGMVRITRQPSPVSVFCGKPAQLNVTASGTPPLAYQWYRSGARVCDAVTPKLAFKPAQMCDAGLYYCVVTNPGGSVVSDSALVKVDQTVVITRQPLAVTVYKGEQAVLSIATSGTVPITYQWFKNRAAVAGATLRTLSIPIVSHADAGSYYCVASNGGGGAKSAAAKVTVLKRTTGALSKPANASHQENAANARTSSRARAPFDIAVNGANAVVWVHHGRTHRIDVYNLDGRRICSRVSSGPAVHTFEAGKLAVGRYLFVVRIDHDAPMRRQVVISR